MLDPALIRRNPEAVRNAIVNKRTGDPSVVDLVLEQDAAWRAGLTELQHAQSESKALARQVGELMREGKKAEAQSAIDANAELKTRVKELEAHVREMEAELDASLLEIPNIPHGSVPIGSSPEDNKIEYEHGDLPAFRFDAKPHWDLAAVTRFVDFERGSKVAGAGFPFYVGPAAKLQRSLVAWFLDVAVERGYIELQSPVVVNEDSVRGTGQLPDKEDQMYTAPRDGLYLIPTAEVPVTNFHRDEILDSTQLPLKYAAWTPCFRREAGSYGKDVRGLNRLHQFDKVELVQFTEPSKSYEALESLREDVEHLLRELRLPYRRLLMCTGDMGFTQAKKYDLEIYSAGQARWLEVSSVSNFEAFQSRRMKIRTRGDDGTLVFVHTLNGSGLALPRVVAGLLENGQQSDGSVTLPDVLVPYFGSDTFR
jgi:seryl-tRNA synthetase